MVERASLGSALRNNLSAMPADESGEIQINDESREIDLHLPVRVAPLARARQLNHIGVPC